MTETDRKNALAQETSPYLLQHANHPVDWYPWNETALEKARQEDKPILLSIGYSTCHWCHVMAHESFENEETAKLMNEHFINIKVDREERPDLDRIYQLAHQFLTQHHGGWPLTMFLAPDDHTPFFGGTYFPDQPRYGMPAFTQILTEVASAYRERRNDITEQNQAIRRGLESNISDPPSNNPITKTPLTLAMTQLRQEFDQQNGGFGNAPKFPHPTSLDYLLRQYSFPTETDGNNKNGMDETALAMVTFTLVQMGNGGICDQVGGGFYRYSVDENWTIPHFEKMLYDNGLLLGLYAKAWQVTEYPLFQRIVFDTGDWVMREMQSRQGGYYSALDADSEGQEGKFYVWSPEEVQQLLTEEECGVTCPRFGLDLNPNFEGKNWHLRIAADAERLDRECNLEQVAIGRLLASARRKLFIAREKRIRPHRDEKVLTSWNALMIKGMASAGRILGEEQFIKSAERALVFIRNELWRDGRLLATYKDEHAHLPAYLDDYVFLIEAILELLQSRWQTYDLAFAYELAEVVLAEFEDQKNGGFYFTANQHEQLIHRPKPMMDEALPAGNGIAAQVLNRLGYILGEERYLRAAERTLKAGWSGLEQFPQAHMALASAVQEHLSPPQIIVLRGQGNPLAEWQRRCQKPYTPRCAVFAIPADIDNLPPSLLERAPYGDVVAYLCEGHQCHQPITDFDELDRVLTEKGM